MLAILIRFVLSAVVLVFVGLLLPGFRVGGFWGALLAALIVAVLGQIARAVFGRRISPQGRGLAAWLLAALAIYLTQFIVPGFRATVLGALLASLAIGVIDAFIPTELR